MLDLDAIVGLGKIGTVWGGLLTVLGVVEHLGYYLGTCLGHWDEGMVVFKWGNMLGEQDFKGNGVGND